MYLRDKRCRGYTLLEMVITLPLLAMLLAGMAAAISLTTKAMPSGNSHTSAPLAVAAACDQFAAELSYANAITSRTATSLQFTCSDRNGDTVAESISYSWGAAGGPWTRTLNGGPPHTLVPDVQTLIFTYQSRTDVVTGLNYLQSVEVKVTAPSNSARPLAVRFLCRNEPQLP